MKPGFCTFPTGAQDPSSCDKRKRNGHGEAQRGAQEGAGPGVLMASSGSDPSRESFKECELRLGLGPEVQALCIWTRSWFHSQHRKRKTKQNKTLSV